MIATPRQRLRARLEDWELLLGLLRSRDIAARQHAAAGMSSSLPALRMDASHVLETGVKEAGEDGHAEAIFSTLDELDALARQWAHGPRPGVVEDLLHHFEVAGEDLLLALRNELHRQDRVIPFPVAARPVGIGPKRKTPTSSRVVRMTARAASFRNG